MNKLDDNYSRNQCSIVIRVDGEEVEIPINFGMTADEIRALYPYIIPLASDKIKNPVMDFSDKAKAGKYNGLSDVEYAEAVERVRKVSKFWFDKAEASLLEVTMRLAVDVKLRGIEELAELFDSQIAIDHIKTEPITDAEANNIIKSMNLETPVDYEHDPGDEQDIPLGIAGGLNVNLYSSGAEEDYLSQELDEMESKLDVDDKFTKILDSDLADVDESTYKSEYKSGAYEDNQVKDGLLNMYSDNNESKTIFEKMDEEDGLFADSEDEELDESTEDDFEDEEVYDDEVPEEDVEISFDDDEGDVSDEEVEAWFSEVDEDGKGDD